MPSSRRPAPINEDSIRTFLTSTLHPWKCKKWKKTKYGYYVTVELTDSSTKRDFSKTLDLRFVLSKTTKAVTVSIDAFTEFVKNPAPTAIAIWHESKVKYILLEEHFVNRLFSENPKLSAQDEVEITISSFSPLTKTKIKDIREFCFKWEKKNYSILKSGLYFDIKERLKAEVDTAYDEIAKLQSEINVDSLKDISEEINRAIYTVAIVGPTKAGKSTIINSLISKNVSPINIRPTTGIPTSIVPGKQEKTEILLKNGKIIPGPATEEFLNEYVAIDRNRSNHKEVKMVTVWIKSSQMEKGLSFCDFPGLDDPDPIIEKTVNNALQFVNAIIYVIDASGMEDGYKFPKQYRDDLLNLKNKDRIFLVVNKIDRFSDSRLLEGFKNFIDEQLEILEIKPFLPQPPIYMCAKNTLTNRIAGVVVKDEMTQLESQIWDHLLENNKSGLHNLMNIISNVTLECSRLSRLFEVRKLHGEKKKELQSNLTVAQSELSHIKMFEREQRGYILTELINRMTQEKDYLLNYYQSYMEGYGLGQKLPQNNQIQEYLIEQFTETAPQIYDQLEDDITNLYNRLNNWVSEKLDLVEIPIDDYSKVEFRNSDSYSNIFRPINNIFSESYGKSVPTGMLANIGYHIFNTIEKGVDLIIEFFTSAQVVRNRKVNKIMTELRTCYDEVFDIMYFAFKSHLDQKCDDLVRKVQDRTNIYVVQLNKQITALSRPLSESEVKLHDIAIERLIGLDNSCNAIRLEIDELTQTFGPNSDSINSLNAEVDLIETELRKYINRIVTQNSGTTQAKVLVPTHLHAKLDDRFNKHLRDHPNFSKVKFKTLESQLDFFDMMEYQDIITNASHWQHFEPVIKNKENLKKHLQQLSNLRNCVKHSRELTKLINAEGKASIVWFKMVLNINE